MPGEVQTRAFGELIGSMPALQSSAGGGRILSLRRLWWAAIVLLGVSAGAVGFTIWQLRNDAIGAAVA
jgi:hypothetical protein